MYRHYGGCTDRWSAERQAESDARDDVRTGHRPSMSDREPYDCSGANYEYRRAYEAAERRERCRAEERRQEEEQLEQMQREMYEAARERQELAEAELEHDMELMQRESDELELHALDEDLPF